MSDFLSLYALTQSDGQAGLNGKVLNTTAAKLFGGMITGVHIGDAAVIRNGIVTKPLDANPYPSINAILDKLGINASPVDGHQNHFHIYLKPPTPQAITANLLADLPGAAMMQPLAIDPQAVLDYVQTLITGEELMFIMDVPTIPMQETPIVLVQAAAPGAPLQPDFILKECQETESTGNPRSAMRGVDPGYMLANYLNNSSDKQVVFKLADIKTTLLQGTQHGKIFAEVDNTGLTSYHYDPTPNYIGNDRATFMAEFEGKRYKIVVNLVVSPHVGETPLLPGEKPVCPPPKLIKVNGKPVSGSSGYNSGYSLNSLSVTFTDLPGGAVGQPPF